MGAVFERDGYAVEAGCICNDDKTMGDDNNRRLNVVRSVFLCFCSSGFGHIPELVRSYQRCCGRSVRAMVASYTYDLSLQCT